MQVAHLEADRVSHIFRVIAAMAAEMFSLIPSEVGDALLIRAQALAVAEDKSCELECHAMLISYVNNRYLEKVYQQFTDGYVSYVILHLKKIIRSRRSFSLNWLTSYARGGVMRLGKLCSVISSL